MKTSIQSVVLFFFILAFPAFAGDVIRSIALGGVGPTQEIVNVPIGSVLTITTFTADGSTASGGVGGTVTVHAAAPASYTTETVVLRSYDPSNLNDTQHTAAIAGAANKNDPAISVSIVCAQNVTTFVTYTLSIP